MSDSDVPDSLLKRRKRLLVIAEIMVLSSRFSPSAMAEVPPKVLDPIIVSASRIPSSSGTTSTRTTIITREEIEARQAISTVDLLRQVSGLHIDQPGGRGGISSVYVRGSDPNFTVVLIDGIKVNDPTNSRGGSFDLSSLDPESIERIEMIRGPLSAVHGSDAMGGVINIITRHGTATPRTSLNLSSGSGDYKRIRFGTSGPLGKADYAFNLSYVDDGPAVEGSQFVGRNISGKWTFSPSNDQWLELVSRYGDSQEESFPDDSGGQKFAVIRTVDQRDAEEWTAGMTYGHDLTDRWAYTFKVGYYHRLETIVSPGVAPGLRDPFGIPAHQSQSRFNRSNVILNTFFSPSSSTRLSIGTEVQLENGESNGNLLFGATPIANNFALDRNIYSAFLETEWTTPLGILLEGGVRLDDSEGFDAELSPRVGLVYEITSSETTLKASWGEGFKLPSFFALGNPIVGNAALVPETGRSFEMGLLQYLKSKQTKLSFTYFHNRFFNLIDFDEGPPPLLVNRSEVRAQGGEMGLSFQFNKTMWVNGHLSYLETDIKGTTEALRNRPEWRGGINTRWQAGALLSSLNILYVGKVLDSSIPTGDRNLDDYFRMDIASAWKLTNRLEISIAIDNLFDADYEEAIGFPAPGIRGRLGVRWEM